MKRLVPLALLLAAGCASDPQLIDPKAVFDRYDWWDSHDQAWYTERIPFIETPDAQIDEIYYYRWEVLKTHLTYGSPETGYVFTEFIDRPSWSGTYGPISCPLGHQFSEARWMNDPRVIDEYARYWFDTPGAQPRRYSNWYASSLWGVHEVWGDDAWITAMLPYMERQYDGWMAENWDPGHRMFFKTGHDDGMEININSRQLTDNWVVEGYRPTLNSYLFGDLIAMSRTALLTGDSLRARTYAAEAESLKARVVEELWDERRQFFLHQFRHDHPPGIEALSLTYETGPQAGSDNGREAIGFVPWQFNLPDAEHAVAWQFLMDDDHFRAPFGPTTTSRTDPQFWIAETCCVWSGQSWPYATTQTLVAMANLLNNYEQSFVDAEDYAEVLQTYSRTHYKDGRPYIAESADPFTGSWFGSDKHNHSEHYLHSGYVDLVLNGLLGIRPQADGRLVINPLIPGNWDYFAVQGLRLHGHEVDVWWDRDGSRFGQGAGLRVRVDGQEVGSLGALGRIVVPLVRRTSAMDSERPHNLAVNNGRAFPAVSASYSSPQREEFYAVDGAIYYHEVPTNRWTTEGSPNAEDWLAVEFGATQVVDEIRLYFLDDGAGVMPPSSYRVELLVDGEWVPDFQEANPAGRRPTTVAIGGVEAAGVRAVFTHASDARTGLAEIEVWSPAGYTVRPATGDPANLALGAPVTVSWPEDADAGVLTDGIPGGFNYQFNRWLTRESPNTEDWARIDLRQSRTVSEVGVHLLGLLPRYAGRIDSTIAAPRAIRVETSPDGVAWSAVTGAEGFPERPVEMARHRVWFDPVEARYVRVVLEHAAPAWSGVAEIEVRAPIP